MRQVFIYGGCSSRDAVEWYPNHNLELHSYWQLIEAHDIPVARIKQEHAIADPDHKWGPAYLHYIPETYQAQLEAITDTI